MTGSTIGRIIGRGLTELLYRARFGRDVTLGEILAVDDDEGGDRTFLLRVHDILYGTEAAAADWEERVAGNIMLLEDYGEDDAISDKQNRLFQVGVCSLLGYLSENNFRKAKTLPPHFARVRLPDDRDYQALRDHVGDISIGNLRSGEEVLPFPVGMEGENFPSHVGIFATTGMGKSNLMKRLAASCLNSGRYGLLILDPHGEYYDGGKEELRGLIHHPMARERMEVYSARELRGPHNRLRVAAHEVSVDDYKQLYDPSKAQVDALETAARVFGDRWLVEFLERDVDGLMVDMPNSYPETLGVIQRKLRNLFHYGLITKDKTVTVTDSIYNALREGKVVLVDTSNMGEPEELLISVVLGRCVLNRNKALFGSNPDGFRRLPPMLITMEEAQRVLGGVFQTGPRRNVFAQIAREGRKFKTGLCAISQQPKLIDEEVLSQFNTLFIMGLADRKDRDILRDSAKQDVSRLGTEIQMLMPGEGLITSPTSPFAIPVKVDLYEDFLSGGISSPRPISRSTRSPAMVTMEEPEAVADPGSEDSLEVGGDEEVGPGEGDPLENAHVKGVDDDLDDLDDDEYDDDQDDLDDVFPDDDQVDDDGLYDDEYDDNVRDDHMEGDDGSGDYGPGGDGPDDDGPDDDGPDDDGPGGDGPDDDGPDDDGPDDDGPDDDGPDDDGPDDDGPDDDGPDDDGPDDDGPDDDLTDRESVREMKERMAFEAVIDEMAHDTDAEKPQRINLDSGADVDESQADCDPPKSAGNEPENPSVNMNISTCAWGGLKQDVKAARHRSNLDERSGDGVVPETYTPPPPDGIHHDGSTIWPPPEFFGQEKKKGPDRDDDFY